MRIIALIKHIMEELGGSVLITDMHFIEGNGRSSNLWGRVISIVGADVISIAEIGINSGDKYEMGYSIEISAGSDSGIK